MGDEGDVDWSDPRFLCPADEETPEVFHGFSADTILQGRLNVKDHGEEILVTRIKKRGKPRGHIMPKPDSKLILDTRRRQADAKMLEPPPHFSSSIPVRQSMRRRPSSPPLPLPPATRKRGRPRSGEPPPPAQPPAPSGVPAACPSEALGTCSRPLLYLIEKPNLAPILKTKLPKAKQVLQRLEGILLQTSNTARTKKKGEEVKRAVKIVQKEIVEVWKYHFGLKVTEGKEYEGEKVSDSDKSKRKMIIDERKIEKKIAELFKEYQDVEYESRRSKQRNNFTFSEFQLKKVLEMPFNIMKTGKTTTKVVEGVKKEVKLPSGEEILASSGILYWREDLEHLKNQLTKHQPGCCDSYDTRQAKRDQRKFNDAITEEKRRSASKAEIAMSKKRAVLSDDDSDKDDCNNDRSYTSNIREPTKKKIDVMGPVAATADRLNLSCAAMAMQSAATARALGVNVADTNISVTKAWRKRTEGRKKLASTIKKTFSPFTLSGLHWDRKSLKLYRQMKGNFVVVFMTGVEEGQPSQLLGIPMAPGGTGREEFEVIRSSVEAWEQIKKESIGPIVFDTTLANSGEFEGVCSYLCEWIGGDVEVFWFGCRKHMIGEIQ